MDFTTLARVKTLGSLATTANDDFLSQLISVVSAEFETYLDRFVEQKAYVEKREVDGLTSKFFLRALPIVTLTSITDPDGDLIDAADYKYHPDEGWVGISYNVPPAVDGLLEFSYTGGIAVDTDTLITAQPDLAFATELQVIQLYQQRKQLGGVTELQIDGGSMTIQDPSSMSKRVRNILDRLRR